MTKARYLDTQFQKTYAEDDGIPFDVLLIGKYKYVLDKEHLEQWIDHFKKEE